jgi:hypothetical protein
MAILLRERPVLAGIIGTSPHPPKENPGINATDSTFSDITVP